MRRYHAAWVLPITAPPIRGGTVAIQGSRIAYVGTRNGAPPGDDVELGDVVLMPGLVNAHTHLELTVLRGMLEGLEFPDWIINLQRAKVEVLDRDRLLDSARAGIAEGVRAGVTCYADTCDSGVALAAMREAGVRGVMYQEVFGPEPERADAATDELLARLQGHRAVADDLRTLGVSPHAPYTVSDRLFSRVAELARSRDLPVAVHIAESREEHEFVRGATGRFADAWRRRGIAVSSRARSPIALLERLGVLGRRTLAIHCVQADPEDVAALASSDTAVAHCPISNAKLGHGIAPLVRMLGAGLRVGLGTDSMASNNRMHLLEEARSAVLMQHVATGSPCAMSARDALALATVGGARALGLAERVGSLEPGKDADLAAFPLGDAAAAAEHDPEATAVWALGDAAAVLVVVAGAELVGPSRPAGRDAALDERLRVAARALADWSAAQGMSRG
ncbi:MAG TPA: amidohydrolase family protein [Gemmatimonadaceae bacterium]|nr:amidohydrolase family protein [Gemmatimonadaceae bacterium]